MKPSGDTRYVKILDPDEGARTVRNFSYYLNAPFTSIVVNFLDLLAHDVLPAAGLVVDESPDALAAAILRLARDPTECEVMGRRARARAEREFTAERDREAAEAIYRVARGRDR